MTVKFIQADSLAKLETAVNAFTPAAFLIIGAIPEPEPTPDPDPDPTSDPDTEPTES